MNIAETAPAVGKPFPGEGLPQKISVRDLKFYYGDTLALKGINLPLYANNVTAFIGPSGCGKSTLLRVLNRMYDLYPKQRAEGEVLLDGAEPSRPQRRISICCARASAWCFRSRRHFRCRSMTTSRSASSSMKNCHAANLTVASRRP